LIPVLPGLAGIGLALFMIGAEATHVIHHEVAMIFVAGAIMIGSAAVGWLRSIALLRDLEDSAMMPASARHCLPVPVTPTRL
jgi:hypothetical protein